MTAVDTGPATLEPAPQATKPRSFTEVWVVSIGHSLTHWYPATFYLLLPLIGNELGLSYSEIGSILAAQYFAGALANIPGGLMVDSFGRKGVLMSLSLFWIGFPYLLMGMSSAYWMLVGCAVLVGIGNNLWHPTAIPWLANRFPERKGLVMSFHGMGGNFGDAVAPLVIGALLATFTWREVVIMNVVPGIIMSGLILLYLGRVYSAETKAGGNKEKHERLKGKALFSSFAALLKSKALVMLCTSSCFRAMTQSALLTFLPLYLAREMGYAVFWVGASMFALQAAGFAAAPIAGHLSDTIGRRQIILSSMTMTGVVLIAMIFAGGTPAFVFLVALLGFFLFSVRAVLQAWLLDSTPRNLGGSAIGVLFGTQAIGQAIGPLCAGLLADRFGIMSAFYFLAATIVIANLFVFFMPDTQKKAAA